MSSTFIKNDDDSKESSPPVKDTSEPVGVAQINIINLNWLDGNSSNSYVKITCSSSSSFEYCKTRPCENRTNPEWNQVFYIPIYDINKKFKIRVYGDNTLFKNVSLGSCILDIKDLIKEKKLDFKRDLTKPKNKIPPRSNKGKLHFVVYFYSFSKPKFTTKSTKFFKTTILFYNLCNLITNHCKNGSFKLTDTLANLFNFNSKDELIKAFTSTIKDNDMKISDIDICGTILITALLETLLHEKDCYTVHVTASETSNKYVSHTIEDIYIYTIEAKTDSGIKTDALLILKSQTTPETPEKIVDNQKVDGSIKLSETVSQKIDISSDNIQSSVQSYSVSEKLKSIPKNVWETALSLRYLNITSQSQDQYKEQSEKAKKYLIAELKDEKLVEELLTTSEKIIVEQSVKKEKENAISTVKNSTTTEKVTEIVSKQKNDGSLELTDTVSKELDVESNESLVSSVKTYFRNKLPDNKKLLDTALTLSFLRKTSSTDTSPELKEKVEKAEKYLKTESGSDEKINELLETTDTVVVEHATKKVIKEKADQSVIEEIQETVTEEEITEIIEIQNNEGKHKSKLTDQNEKALAWLHSQIKDEKLEKEILEACEKIVVEKASNKKKETFWNYWSDWGSGWGNYISDIAKSAADDSIKLDKTVSDQIKQSKSTTEGALNNVTNSKITIDNNSSKRDSVLDEFLKLVYCNYKESEWKDRYYKSWLHARVRDEKLEKEILECIEHKKYLIQEFKEVVNQVIIKKVQESITKEVYNKIIETQNEDGFFDTFKQIISDLDITTDEIIKVSITFLTLAYCKKVLAKYQFEAQSKKARAWLHAQINDEKLEDEILESCEKILAATMFWGVHEQEWYINQESKDAVNRLIIEKVQESITKEEYNKVIETQNEDGSFGIFKQITDDLGITTDEVIKVSITFLTLAYCKKVLAKYQPEFKSQNEKARAWLHTQVKDEKLENELLGICENFVVGRVSGKRKEEPFDKELWFGWDGDEKVSETLEIFKRTKHDIQERKRKESGWFDEGKCTYIHFSSPVNTKCINKNYFRYY
ncbi:hypothetical protein RclHR1_02180036 [Rhizophagus clarus]|uniref:C2 domain-containing protein n=1 Tax=Rhizophagus clarus TaxID=94130 RepID=A0A2Z6R6T8_9GLOM|nr:hypothetical protein RclHR1_02180036 [Rhizophagus clarus]